MQKLDKQGRAYATGKRKDAVARVWLKPGAGRIIVNTRDARVVERKKYGKAKARRSFQFSKR